MHQAVQWEKNVFETFDTWRKSRAVKSQKFRKHSAKTGVFFTFPKKMAETIVLIKTIAL